MKREVIQASDEHKKNFRETFELREDLKDDHIWQAAYEYAADYRLYPDEMAAIGTALVRKNKQL